MNTWNITLKMNTFPVEKEDQTSNAHLEFWAWDSTVMGFATKKSDWDGGIEAEGNQLSSKLLEHAERLEWAEQLGISSDVDVESAGLRYWRRRFEWLEKLSIYYSSSLLKLSTIPVLNNGGLVSSQQLRQRMKAESALLQELAFFHKGPTVGSATWQKPCPRRSCFRKSSSDS